MAWPFWRTSIICDAHLHTQKCVILFGFGGLDEFTRERLNVELMRIVAELMATTLFVTQNILEAIFLADEVMVMTPTLGRLAGIVHVAFERPRKPELTLTPEFNALVAEVCDILGAH